MNCYPIFLGFARLLITFPSALKLLFICLASSSLIPDECVYLTRSDPAKSIMWNLEDFIVQTPESLIDLVSICVERTACERELSLFMA